MTRAVTRHGVTTFAYDPLGRRIAKHSQASDGTTLRNTTRTIYGWDGDTLALESSVHHGHVPAERTVHYVYERDSFVPLVQTTRSKAVPLAPTTDVKALMARNGGKYEIALDPLWNGEYEQEAEPFGQHEIAFYQCDHLGTPQELTDHKGKVEWSAQYMAWGQAKEAIRDAAYKAGMQNPIRFQGQYLDNETGLHYNRYRYYDPDSGRFASRDPIGLRGGLNGHTYAPNPVQWVDPRGLTPIKCNQTKSGRFRSADAAAKAALLRYNDKSIRDNREYGGLIYKTPNGGYDFTKASKGSTDGVDPWEFGEGRIPKCAEEVGYWHTHGNYSDDNGNPTTKDKDAYDSNNFSPQDRKVAKMMGQGKTEYKGYVGTPSGAFKGYDGKSGKTYGL